MEADEEECGDDEEEGERNRNNYRDGCCSGGTDGAGGAGYCHGKV